MRRVCSGLIVTLATGPQKTTPPAGEAHGGDGTAESARVLLIPLESELLLIPTGYHSTRPPFVKGVAENANDSGG